MIKSEQVISLIRSHIGNDDIQFKRIAMQISAAEARAGHSTVAASINQALNPPMKLHSFGFKALNRDCAEMLLHQEITHKLQDLIVDVEVKKKIERIIQEYINQDKLHKFNLDNRRKILLYGASGTGKTMTAEILAQELNLPFVIVRTEKVVTKFMGETGLKLGQIFDAISSESAVYLFDEFDAIGSQRGIENEVGEQRRILNTFLQLLERDHSNSIIVAATNNVEILDKALFRRFDDVIEYVLPHKNEILMILREAFCQGNELNIYTLSDALEGLSHAEIKLICADALKESILYGVTLTNDVVLNVLKQRNIHHNNVV